MSTLRVSAEEELCGLIQALSDLPGIQIDIRIPDSAPAEAVFRAIGRAGFEAVGRVDLDGALRLRGRSGIAPSILDHATVAGHA